MKPTAIRGMPVRTIEFRLLLACLGPERQHAAVIRQMVAGDIDWRLFAQKAVHHEVAGLAGRALSRVASDMVPDDILYAFGVIVDRTRRRNRALFDELTAILEALAMNGVEAIPFKGPALAIQAYGDLGLLAPDSLHFLIRDPDIVPTIATLSGLGYERQGQLTAVQFAMIQRLQGHEVLLKKAPGTVVKPHTRLTPLNMAFDIDYAGLWRRAQRSHLDHRSMRTLAPEDNLLVLAILGAKEMWWNLKWACDVAAFIGSHSKLDWTAIIEHARAQGCLRLFLLATSLARRHFNSAVPEAIIAAERADRLVEPMLERIMAYWQLDGPVGPRSGKALLMDRQRLHQGFAKRTRYLARTVFLPTPHHVARTPLPSKLSFAYFPIKIAHDIAALPKRRSHLSSSALAGPTGKGADLANSLADPESAAGWAIDAGHLYDSKRYVEAIEASDRALSLDPGDADATRVGIHARLHSCDWRRREDDKRRITEGLRAGRHMISPFFHRAICESDAEALAFARFWARAYSQSPEPLWRGERYRHDRVRVAYMSVELHDPTTWLIAGVFEHHDTTRFETTGILLGPGDGSEMRRRIDTAFGHLVSVHAMTDREAARLLRELEIDIIIDLKGNTGDRRTGILAHRPAPVQVNYLGYPGTMGVRFIDYIVTDRIVIPDEQRVHYSEKVVYLPHCYVPNDDKNRIAERTPSRAEAELPEEGFVFSCFNHTYKIGPEIFDVWMRLLHAVDGSILWLRHADIAAMSNLLHEARARGIAPDRIVFAPHVPNRDDYFARHRLADLFLDTLPFNAHASANDALWAGLPVLTCMGNTAFARVAASQLHAIGLPELVTSSLAEYEALALALAHDPERLTAVRAKLDRNRRTEPLFDTAQITRNLESAYTIMWDRTQRHEAPGSFSVLDASVG
ncbi:MAG: nucleotidyltransferase family protein [Xanthobacteraceae bacterium]